MRRYPYDYVIPFEGETKDQPTELELDVDKALSDTGYPDTVVMPGHPLYRSGWEAGVLATDSHSGAPRTLVHRAFMLSKLRSDGPERRVTCDPLLGGRCPLHPVGALLAGTAQPCDGPPQYRTITFDYP